MKTKKKQKKKSKENIYNKAFLYRVYPEDTQEVYLYKNEGCKRYVYNNALNWRDAAYAADGTYLSYKDTAKALTQIKRSLPWLKEADSTALQHSLECLDEAYKNFFEGRAEHPKFKTKRSSRKTFTVKNNNNSIKIIDDKYIKIPKIEPIRAKIHRKPPRDWKICTATIIRETDGNWYIAITFKCQLPQPT
jgi:putative transposase